MKQTASEQTAAELALARVFDYLADSNVTLDNATSIEVLALVEAGLRDHATELLPWVMAQLSARFHLNALRMPAIQPPLLRGSIGYGHAGND